jgi:5'(3')-deoxyribonucleotidase
MSDIIVDVDGVVANFTSPLLQRLASKFGGVLEECDIATWDFIRETLPPEQRSYALHVIMADPTFWLDLPRIPGALEGIEALINAGHHIIWATSPYYGCHSWVDYRLQWLRREFGHAIEAEGSNFEFHFATIKFRIAADVIIDDKPATIDAWAKRHPQGLALRYSYPFNRDLPLPSHNGFTFSWDEVDALIAELKNEADRRSNNVLLERGPRKLGGVPALLKRESEIVRDAVANPSFEVFSPLTDKG